MKRHYYISNDLDDLEIVERDLESAGVSTPQIHVLSEDDSGVETHHLHEVEAVLKQDVVHGTEIGAVVGVIAAAAILLLFWLSGLTETYTWVPAIFLSVIVLGFCTWEGGFIGIQNPGGEPPSQRSMYPIGFLGYGTAQWELSGLRLTRPTSEALALEAAMRELSTLYESRRLSNTLPV